MEAGRELDASVAEKVMGWKRISTNNWPWQMVPPGSVGLTKVMSCPHYSTDFHAAWEVVEEMRIRGFLFELSWDKSEDEWGVLFLKIIDDACGCQQADTAPHAICLAAFRAVGG